MKNEMYAILTTAIECVVVVSFGTWVRVEHYLIKM